MFTSYITIDLTEMNSLLTKKSKILIETSYKTLYEKLKNIYKLSEFLNIIDVCETTHYKYLKDDSYVSYSLKCHIYFLLELHNIKIYDSE